MSRPKKEGVYLNIKLEKEIYNKLIQICDQAGQTKTLVVERALDLYFNEYDKKLAILSKHEEDAEE